MMICFHLKVHCCAKRNFCNYNRNMPQVNYVTFVREILPQGSYCLAGYSFGASGMCGCRDGVATGENKLCCGRGSLYSSSLIDQLTQ